MYEIWWIFVTPADILDTPQEPNIHKQEKKKKAEYMAASAVSTNRLFVFLSSLSGTRRNVIPTSKAMSGIGNISGPTPPSSPVDEQVADSKINKKKEKKNGQIIQTGVAESVISLALLQMKR